MPVLLSCSEDDDVIWDIAPVEFCFEVFDTDGNDMLSPDGGAYFGSDFKIIYDGEEYPVAWTGADLVKDTELRSRDYAPVFNGFYFSRYHYENNGVGRLVFGEFDGSTDRNNMIVSMVDPDGTSHEIVYNRTVRIKGSKLNVKQTVTFDGQEVSGTSPFMVFRIVR